MKKFDAHRCQNSSCLSVFWESSSPEFQPPYSGGHGDLEWGEKQAGPGPLPALLKWSAEGGGILPDFCGGMNP